MQMKELDEQKEQENKNLIERIKLTVMLLAIVKFRMVPQNINSKELLFQKALYMIIMHLFTKKFGSEGNNQKLLDTFCEANDCNTIQDQRQLFDKLIGIIGKEKLFRVQPLTPLKHLTALYVNQTPEVALQLIRERSEGFKIMLEDLQKLNNGLEVTTGNHDDLLTLVKDSFDKPLPETSTFAYHEASKKCFFDQEDLSNNDGEDEVKIDVEEKANQFAWETDEKQDPAKGAADLVHHIYQLGDEDQQNACLLLLAKFINRFDLANNLQKLDVSLEHLPDYIRKRYENFENPKSTLSSENSLNN